MAEVVLAWHGPTTLLDRRGTLAADVLADIISEKSGAFLPALVQNSALFSIDACSFSFNTGRYASEFVFQGDIAITDIHALQADAHMVYTRFSEMLADIASGKLSVTAEDIRRVAVKNRNARVFRHEKPSSYLRDLGWCWGAADIEYFLEYEQGLASISPDDIRDLSARWLRDHAGVALLWVHDDTARTLRARDTAPVKGGNAQ
jgi:predicted Zn-dependent peptidase